MIATIITYSSCFQAIVDFLFTNQIKDASVREYCNGEILETVESRYLGPSIINITYPTLETNQLKRLIGCSDVIYIDRLTHQDDINTIKQHLNVDELPNDLHVRDMHDNSIRLVRLPKLDTDSFKLIEKFTLNNVKLSSKHLSREFNGITLRHKKIQRLRDEYLECLVEESLQ